MGLTVHRLRREARSDQAAADLPGLAGEPGFEPRQTESESVVLPLHHSPTELLSEFNDLLNRLAVGRLRILRRSRLRRGAFLPARFRAGKHRSGGVFSGREWGRSPVRAGSHAAGLLGIAVQGTQITQKTVKPGHKNNSLLSNSEMPYT